MPNWSEPGRDMPSRHDIEDMERDNARRRRDYAEDERRISRYLKDHPDSSWAEANYYSQN